MATETFKELYQGQLAATDDAARYAVPASTQTIVKHIRVVNTDSVDRTVTIYHTNGGAGGAATTILPATTILAGAWAEFEGTITMDAADELRAFGSSANKITMTVYGLEIVP